MEYKKIISFTVILTVVFLLSTDFVDGHGRHGRRHGSRSSSSSSSDSSSSSSSSSGDCYCHRRGTFCGSDISDDCDTDTVYKCRTHRGYAHFVEDCTKSGGACHMKSHKKGECKASFSGRGRAIDMSSVISGPQPTPAPASARTPAPTPHA